MNLKFILLNFSEKKKTINKKMKDMYLIMKMKKNKLIYVCLVQSASAEALS